MMRVAAFAAHAATLLLAALMCAIAFLPGDIYAAFGPLLRLSNTISVIVLVLTGAPAIRAAGWRGVRTLWPIACFLIALITATVSSFDRATSMREVSAFAAAVLLMLATASASRDARTRRALLGVTLVCLIAIGLLVLHDAMQPLPAFNGRIVIYPSVQQWGGYPELGLLAGMGLGGGTALLLLATTRRIQLFGLALACFFTIVSLVLLSRAAWLASLITSALLMLLALWRGIRRHQGRQLDSRQPDGRQPEGRRGGAIAGAAITIALALFVSLTVPTVRQYARTMAEPFRQPAVSMRINEWRTVWRMIGDHPWLGTGPGTYPTMATYYQAETRVHAHNLALHAAVEMGVVGAAAMLTLFGAAIWWAGRASLDGDGTAPIVFGVLLFFLVRSQFDYFFALAFPIVRAHLFVAVWVGLAFGLALDRRAAISPRSR